MHEPTGNKRKPEKQPAVHGRLDALVNRFHYLSLLSLWLVVLLVHCRDCLLEYVLNCNAFDLNSKNTMVRNWNFSGASYMTSNTYYNRRPNMRRMP